MRVCVSSGTGASCIYPLLGATMNGWYFLATEVDDICFDYATKNVEQNNLSDLVKGKCGPLTLKNNEDIRALLLNSVCQCSICILSHLVCLKGRLCNFG